MDDQNHQRLTGVGPPAHDLGKVGDRYTDNVSGQAWAKRKTGWSNGALLNSIRPTINQKAAWVRAAQRAGKQFEDWVIETLDAGAKEPTLKRVADLKEGDLFLDCGKIWKLVEKSDPYATLETQDGKPGSVHLGRVVEVVKD